MNSYTEKEGFDRLAIKNDSRIILVGKFIRMVRFEGDIVNT